MMSLFRYYLIDHPTISGFVWDPPNTVGSTTRFTTLAVVCYLVLTLIFSKLTNFCAVPPPILRPISAAHSLILSLLSLIMVVGTALSISFASDISPHAAAFCFPLETVPKGPLFFWGHVFYLSKLLEFVDTALILVSGERGKRRLSLLHVYHHAAVVVITRVWLDSRQSFFPVALAMNAAVHVVMYYYYFLTSVGARPNWKRLVTNVQITQFVSGLGLSLWSTYLHFSGNGCSGMWSLAFTAAFTVSLLALFLDFHAKSYHNNRDKANKAT